MKETDFVRQNKEKWKSFEQELKNRSFKPNQVTDFYIDTLDDLSFARSHYPNRQVRAYLNGLTRLLSLRIYRTQRATWQQVVKFWKTDLPLVMFHSRGELLFSFLLFVFACAIGVFSSMHDPDFTSFILGEEYVAMTTENIAKGDPMAVYKDENQGGMFLGITVNNIFVAVRTFLFSLLIGIGAVVIMLYNGVMLGSFQYFFFERGLGFESALTIWQHGTVEISSIILAGAAGFVLAGGVLFPGTYSRLDAFRISGRKSLIIMLSLIPLLMYAGFVEAFVTRYTEMHWMVRLGTILLSLGFVLGYFVWYPRRVAAQTSLEENVRMEMQPIKTSAFNPTELYGNVKLTGFAMVMMINHLRSAFLLALGTGIAIAVWLMRTESIPFSSADHQGAYFSAMDLLTPELGVEILIANLLFFSSAYLISFYISTTIYSHSDKWDRKKSVLKKSWLALLFGSISALLLSNYYSMAGILLWLPASMILYMSAEDHKQPIFERLSAFPKLSRSGYWSTFGMVIVLAFFIWMSTIIAENILDLVLFAGHSLIPPEMMSAPDFTGYASIAVICTLILLLCSLTMVAAALSYYSIKERADATWLYKRLGALFPEREPQDRPRKGILSKTNLESR